MPEKKVPSLSGITIYPVKSTGGLNLSQAWVEKQGLAFDRRFMLALDDGSMITARQYPQLFNVSATLIADGLCLSYPGCEYLVLKYAQFALQEAGTHVFNDNFVAWTTTDAASQWFSAILGKPVRLLFTGEQSNRLRAAIPFNVSFADGYPLLIISEASLQALNQRSDEHFSMSRFRPNLVVSGTEAFDEDGWKYIRIGDVVFEGIKPCVRCVMTTIDPSTTELSPQREPLMTLSTFRADEQGNVKFGHNLVALNEGVISVGDVIEVLEEKPREIFRDLKPDEVQLTCVEREDIADNFCTFWFESATGDRLPAYHPGQHLAVRIKINDKSVTRRYTLSSSPSRPGRYAISVRRQTAGQVSGWLHDHLQVGDSVMAEHPAGDFYLAADAREPLLLLAAGSGITPMLSIVRYLSDQKSAVDIVLCYQCRTRGDIACLSELEQLQRAYPSLTVQMTLTQPDSHWAGKQGRLSTEDLKDIPDLTGRQVFVCGPDGFMKTAKHLLLTLGLPPGNYHQEAFNSVTVQKAAYQALAITVNDVIFQGNNQQPLLVQAEQAGLAIPYRCRAGICGQCKVRVLGGEVDQPAVAGLSQAERDDNYALACCCVPLTGVQVSY